MRSRYVPQFVALMGVAALALTGCGGSDDAVAAGQDDASAPLTLATVPMADDPSAVNPVEQLAALLEAETGRTVEVTDVPDYLSVVEAIRAEHVDFGLMSGFPSALAVNTGEIDALMAWEGDDSPVSTCVVLEDSPIQEVSDLEGATLAFADQASSSGYFMPTYMLHEAGLEQDVDYEAMFAGGHEGSFVALEQGQVDAACTANMMTQLGEPYFPFEDGEWRAVGQSPAMPVAMSVLSRQSLDDTTRTQLQEAIQAIFVEENAESLGAYGEGTIGSDVVLDPGPDMFAGLVDIASVAGVDIEDLR